MGVVDKLRLEIPFIEADAIAGNLKREIAPWCKRIDIAGSVRRKRPVCGDIDIVCLPRPGMTERIVRHCMLGGRMVRNGGQYVMIIIPGGVQLDLWFAHEGPSDLFGQGTCNYGALLLTRTGSIEHNIRIVQRAKALGLRYHPHKGVMRDGVVVASETEGDIFKALGMEFVEPEKREVS